MWSTDPARQPLCRFESGPGYLFHLQGLHKLLKFFTFSSTWTQAVDKVVDISPPQYTYTKRGVFYFFKSVPTDLRHHYLQPRIVQSLKTKSQAQARYASLNCYHAWMTIG